MVNHNRNTSPEVHWLHRPPSRRPKSLWSEQGMHEGVRQPVLVFLRRPPTLAHQHPVYVSSGKHPEDIPCGRVIKRWSKPSRIAQGSDHSFLPLIAQAFSLPFQFCQLRCHHTRAAQQIECCTLRVVDLPGNRGSEPQPGFGVTRAQCFLYRVLIIGTKSSLIEKVSEYSRL